MPKNRKKSNPASIVGRIFLGLVGLGLIITVFLYGNNIALFNAKGLIAHEQRSLMILTVAALLVLAIPALFLVFFIAWKYRESNTKAVHDPDVRHGRMLDVSMWLIPSILAVILAGVMWSATHRLEPQKLIKADAKPLTIQVISLRWKWLFIYPEQNIATVNFVQIPVDTPVQFELTADEMPMSSFWIPNLGGMLYTMTGHVNHLNLMANTPGDYPGSSAEINGAGFAGMKFTARASSEEDFDTWVQQVKQSPQALDTAEYESLLQPTEKNPTVFYSAADSGLYDTILMKYMGTNEGHMHEGMHHE